MIRHPAAVVLAAGGSRRMAGGDKLLLPFRHTTILRTTVEALCPAMRAEIVVVAGGAHRAVAEALAGLPVRVAHHAGWAEGLGASLRYGVSTLPDDTAGYMVVLADMPLVRTDTYATLLRAFADDPYAGILAAAFEGRRGHPVLFAARYREQLLALSGDSGARRILEQHATDVRLVAVHDPGVLVDIDTPEAYARLTRSDGQL